MASSKPALSLALTYCARMAWSAAGEPVNRPVLMAPGVLAIVLARAAPAAIQASCEVSLSIQAHAASGFFAFSGITNALPLATVNGWPLASLNGTAEISTSFTYGVSTLTNHCGATWAPTWSWTNWFLSPKKSKESVKLLTLA